MTNLSKKTVSKFMKIAKIEHLKENFYQNSAFNDFNNADVVNDFSPMQDTSIDSFSQESVEVDVGQFAMKLANAIADVFEETFGNKQNVSIEQVQAFTESMVFKTLNGKKMNKTKKVSEGWFSKKEKPQPQTKSPGYGERGYDGVASSLKFWKSQFKDELELSQQFFDCVIAKTPVAGWRSLDQADINGYVTRGLPIEMGVDKDRLKTIHATEFYPRLLSIVKEVEKNVNNVLNSYVKKENKKEKEMSKTKLNESFVKRMMVLAGNTAYTERFIKEAKDKDKKDPKFKGKKEEKEPLEENDEFEGEIDDDQELLSDSGDVSDSEFDLDSGMGDDVGVEPGSDDLDMSVGDDVDSNVDASPGSQKTVDAKTFSRDLALSLQNVLGKHLGQDVVDVEFKSEGGGLGDDMDADDFGGDESGLDDDEDSLPPRRPMTSEAKTSKQLAKKIAESVYRNLKAKGVLKAVAPSKKKIKESDQFDEDEDRDERGRLKMDDLPPRTPAKVDRSEKIFNQLSREEKARLAELILDPEFRAFMNSNRKKRKNRGF